GLLQYPLLVTVHKHDKCMSAVQATSFAAVSSPPLRGDIGLQRFAVCSPFKFKNRVGGYDVGRPDGLVLVYDPISYRMSFCCGYSLCQNMRFSTLFNQRCFIDISS